MRRAVLRMRGSTAGTDSRRLSRSVALSAKDLITGASYNVRASRLARQQFPRSFCPAALPGPPLRSARSTTSRTGTLTTRVRDGHPRGSTGSLLVEPGSSRQSGDRAARTRPGDRRPRLRALPASRHRTRIGHRTRARCPNLLQRRPRTPRTADITAESCGFISATRTPQRPLQQIWTTGDPLDHPQPGGPRPSTSPDPPDPEDRVLAASAQRARSGHRPDHGAVRVRRRTRGARRRPERRSQMSNMSPTAPESPVFSLGSSP